MKTLHFILKREWFYRHLEDKPEDYRKPTPYWIVRLLEWSDGERISPRDAEQIAADIQATGILDFRLRARKFDMCQARMGYAANAPMWRKKFLDTKFGIGNPTWGAPSHPVFIIELGKIIETRNLKS